MCNIPVRVKLEYEEVMNGRQEEIVIDGKKYTQSSKVNYSVNDQDDYHAI